MLFIAHRLLFAQATAPGSGPSGQAQPSMLMTFAPMILLFVMMYFMLIRPQQQKAKTQREMLKTLKRGDRVLTSGGILATIVSVSEQSITIRSADTKLEVQKSAVTEVLERSSEA